MTQPIGPYAQPLLRSQDDAPAPPVYPNIPDPPEPPDLPDVDAEIYAKLTRLAPSPPTESPALQAIGAAHHARDVRVQQRLDTFRARATATYHTPSGDQPVTVPFQMGAGAVTSQCVGEVAAAGAGLGLSAADVTRLVLGRGTPAQVQRVTQVLIDTGHLPAPSDTAPSMGKRIRLMMSEHGLGLDCAGYVAQAFDAAHGIDRAHSPLRGTSPENEQLANLGDRGFVRVGLDETRPGDVIVLKPRPGEAVGHTAIVYGARDATEGDMAELKQLPLSAGAEPSARDFVEEMRRSSDVRTIVVDSSWGNGSDPQMGGVQRRIWWHDEISGKWAWTDGNGELRATPDPYDHPIDGAYRPRSEF